MADCGFKKINQVKEQPLLYLRLGQIQILQKYNFSLTRLSKANYYQSFFDLNICNMRQTWKGINELIGNGKKKNKRNSTNSIRPNPNEVPTSDPKEIIKQYS